MQSEQSSQSNLLCATFVHHEQFAQEFQTTTVFSSCGLHAVGIDAPEAFRANARRGLTAQSNNPTTAGCAIKGNISSDGKRIYHVPGQTWYDRTRIDRENGERWFCSEAEARAAGWRRARR